MPTSTQRFRLVGEDDASAAFLKVAAAARLTKTTMDDLGSASLGLTKAIGGASLIPIAAAATAATAELGTALGAAAGAGGIFGLSVAGFVKDMVKQQTQIASTQKSLDGATKGTQTYADTLAKLHSEQQAFNQEFGPAAKGLGNMKAAFSAFKDSTSVVTNGVLAKGFNLVASVLPKLVPVSNAAGKAVGGLLDDLRNWTKGPEFNAVLNWLKTSGPKAITAFGHSVGNVVEGLGGILSNFVGPGDKAVQTLERLTKGFAAWGKSKGVSDSVNKFLSYMSDNGPKIAASLGALATAAPKIASSLGQLGSANLSVTMKFLQLIASLPQGAFNIVVDGLFGIYTGAKALTILTSVKALLVGATTAMSALGDACIGTRIQLGLLNATSSKLRFASATAGIVGLGVSMLDASKHGASLGDVLGGTLSGALTGLVVGGPIGALIGGAAGGGLTALAGAFHHTATNAEAARVQLMKREGFASARQGAKDLTTALDGVVSAYSRIPRAAVKASFVNSSGQLEPDVKLLRDAGVSMSTIVSATMGQASAQKIVSSALSDSVRGARGAVTLAKQQLDYAKQQVVTVTQNGRTYRVRDTAEVQKASQAYEDAQKHLHDLQVEQGTFGKRIASNTQAISDHTMQVRSLARDLGITVAAYKKFPKQVRTDIEANGLPQTNQDALRLIGQYKGLQSFRNIQAVISAPGVTLTAGQIKDLGTKYHLLPSQVKTLIALEGVGAAVSGAQQVKSAIDTIPSFKTSTITVVTRHMNGTTYGTGGHVAGGGAGGAGAGAGGSSLGRSMGRGLMDGLMRGIADRNLLVQTALSRVQGLVSKAGNRVSNLMGIRKGFLNTFQATSLFSQDLSHTTTDAQGNTVTTPETIKDIIAYQQQQKSQAHHLLKDIKAVEKMGLSKSLINQLRSQGTSGAAALHALAMGGPGQIRLLNSLNKQTNSDLAAAGMKAGNYARGGSINDDIRRARKQERVLDRLEHALHELVKSQKKDQTIVVEIDSEAVIRAVHRRNKRKGVKSANL